MSREMPEDADIGLACFTKLPFMPLPLGTSKQQVQLRVRLRLRGLARE